MYDHIRVEAAARELWESAAVYRYQPGDEEFSVDTPPAYVSADHLHVGHAMSYSQPDFIVRYRRMRGERVFYPMGFDDNGPPPERRAADEELWRRLGLSVDWSLRYSTVDERCQRAAQASFLALHERGYIRRAEDPVLWCPLDRTALAQADIEDSERTGVLYPITFAGAEGQSLPVATTRPELLPACVALYHHPDDPRYTDLAAARVPLFGYEVPVLADERVDQEYGTGLMMVCTFGDGEDVRRWRRDRLPLRLAVTPDGRLGELAGPYAGLTLEQGRKAISGRLGSAIGARQIRHVVGVHERCQTPAEFQIRPQWLVALLEHTDRFRARAAELEWIPPFTRRRLEDWIDGLKWDWNISRQRRYGVPFPVWFCSSCGTVALARLADLPVDPLTAEPAGPCASCGSAAFTPDEDVMDTWMTSSLTPWITRGWDSGPMSMRVQGFEIIRTWLFYSIVQSELHAGRLPWRTALIAGWGLNERGRKPSKRELSSARYSPSEVMAEFGADALRLWVAKARGGTDLRYNEDDIRAGRKFAVKLWNVGRFVGMNLGEAGPAAPAPPAPERGLVDRWVLSHLADAVAEATAAFESHDYAAAHQVAMKVFWSVFCDRYLEMIKDRVGSDPGAQWTLREAFRVLLALFAPFAPFVTEQMYQRFYRPAEGVVSLHLTAWPEVDQRWVSDRSVADQLALILDATRALRTRHKLGGATRLRMLTLKAHTPAASVLLELIAEPLRVAARADAVQCGEASYPSGVDGITVAISAASLARCHDVTPSTL